MKPSIGRIVHFVHDHIHYAAIITKVLSPYTVNLYAFPNGSGALAPVVYTATLMEPTDEYGNTNNGSWHWPETV